MINTPNWRANFNRYAGGLLLACAEIRASIALHCMLALALAIAATGTIFIYGLGIGTSSRIDQQISRLGANLMVISEREKTGAPVENGSRLFNQDVIALKSFPNIDMVSSITASTGLFANYSQNVRAEILGTDPSYFDILGLTIASGRKFFKNESKQGLPVVILGSDLAAALSISSEQLPSSIRINSQYIQVVGIMRPKGVIGSQNIDQSAITPIATLASRISVFDETAPNRLTNILISAKTTVHLQEAKDSILRFFSSQNKPVILSDAIQIADTASKIGSNYQLLYNGVILAITVILIMLVSVSFHSIILSRYREINLSVLVGASSGFIVFQYTTHFIILFLTSTTPSAILATIAVRSAGAALNLPIEINLVEILMAQTLTMLFMTAIIGAMALQAYWSARYISR